MERNFHKIDKEHLQKPHHLSPHRKKHKHEVSGKTFLPFCSPQGLRTLKSDAPVCPGCHPAGAHQSNKQSAPDHTGTSAWHVHPYKLFLFTQHNLIPFFPSKKVESNLGNSHEPEPAWLGPICTPASKHVFKNLVTTKYFCNPLHLI